MATFIVLFTSGDVFCGEFEDTLMRAEQGDLNAQLNLGVMYFEGRGAPQDIKKAVSWFKKAAE